MTTSPHNDICQLVRDPIDMPALVRQVRAPEDGAIVTFDGFVRNQSHNRPTLYLDYEAYESMALAKMREIAAQLHEKFAIDRLKRTVPIWKKEYFEDGAVWADGELPPAPAATPRAKPAS